MTFHFLLARAVVMDASELTQHAAFLGGSGSGKTTLALSVIEQLLLEGIPAVLVDRAAAGLSSAGAAL